MRTIGIRELKAQLSRVLRLVQDGEAILITDRGRVVAELRRPDGPGRGTGAMSRAERVLGQWAVEGRLRLAEAAVEPYPASPLALPEGSARELLAEDRGEP